MVLSLKDKLKKLTEDEIKGQNALLTSACHFYMLWLAQRNPFWYMASNNLVIQIEKERSYETNREETS